MRISIAGMFIFNIIVDSKCQGSYSNNKETKLFKDRLPCVVLFSYFLCPTSLGLFESPGMW